MKEPSNNKNTAQSFSMDGGKTKLSSVDVPSISLPKGGGAIKGMDEKFSVNALNGSSSLSLPLPFTAARGITPNHSLIYDSGAGNGPFGLGWRLSLPSIKRKTHNGLPQYIDDNNSDTYLFSEVEDLVPEFSKDADGNFELDSNGDYIIHEKNSAEGLHRIRFYKPRIEGLFAKIERWTEKVTGGIKWRIITRDNITTLYGWSNQSIIADPKNNSRIFEWLPEFVFDDKGNCAHYIYKKEDAAGIDASLPHNRNRIESGQINYVNLYSEKIYYGNKTPYKKFGDPFPLTSNYLFETIFDYGEYDSASPFGKTKDWAFRKDAFSHYRAGFEIRTTRLCRRILQLHHFADDEYNGLVRSLNLQYDTATQEGFTFLQAAVNVGYIKKTDGSYSLKEMPALDFEYQKHQWNAEIKTISTGNMVHAPEGLQGGNYQFTDLYNEGLAGILTEQAGSWYYKHNAGAGKFEPAKEVASKPSFYGLGTQLFLTDLDADGGKQLASYNSEPKGYFELTENVIQESFKSFKSLPNIYFNNPNNRLIDLTGDGKAALLFTEDNVFTWYPSDGRNGFLTSRKTRAAFEEEKGPNIVFSDEVQTIFMADMSGDGLTDIVRIRNGEVCYWPNLGFGKFGARILMDNAPWFDHPGSFNPAFIRLADIDGSGTTDIIYLGKNTFSCWLNMSGNSFALNPFEIVLFPAIDNRSNVMAADILGNGLSCIVWHSATGDFNSPVRYIDLMNSLKPHILASYKNNMGKEVTLEYKPSTWFYIQDKEAGTPWKTKLHFPVHCIAKTTTLDKITGCTFISSYKYHHGYYDYAEKEFRGFGMVEQTDAEDFEHWVKSGASNITEADLHQEPVITKTWYHTGANPKNGANLNQFSSEYWYEAMKRKGYPVENKEADLPEAKLTGGPGISEAILEDLSPVEWQQAFRACKGMYLRSEVFAKDATKLGNTPESLEKECVPFTVSTHNGHIELLQPKGHNQYAIYVVKESEVITYNYERDPADPRTAHTLNIKMDEYGNILESASVVYGRSVADSSLPGITQESQKTTAIIFTQKKFTKDVIDDEAFRLRLPSEIISFELKGVSKSGVYYQLEDFEGILSDSTSTTALYYEFDKEPPPGKAQKRIIEHVRTTYYNNNLDEELPLYDLHSLGIPYESYQLAFTTDLLTHLFDSKVDETLLTEGKFYNTAGDNNWWVRSGRQQFLGPGESTSEAQNRFYTPVSFLDPYRAKTAIKYYGNYFLMMDETTDALGNKSTVQRFNFRTLSPTIVKDLNHNLSGAIADELGLVKAVAVMGKDLNIDGMGDEADDLTGFSDFTSPVEINLINEFFNAPLTAEGVDDSVVLTNRAKQLLQHATTRFAYDFGAYKNTGKPIVVATITREEHFHKKNDATVQMSFEYTSGLGQVISTKVQAEPGLAKKASIDAGNLITITELNTALMNPVQLRWVGNGKVVLNNKGNPVKQYEPYFSVTHRYEDFKELAETGVTPIMFYDALGRLIKTTFPDGSFSKIVFNSWQQTIFDTNDTSLEPECSWYLNRVNRLIDAKLLAEGKDPEKEKKAAEKAAHHANTPNTLHFDSLGRTVLSIEHNKNISSGIDEFMKVKTVLDVEGNLRKVLDARTLPENGGLGNTLMEYRYNMLGTPVYQHSMDTGKRWFFNDILGNPLSVWDERDLETHYFYDPLHRPVQTKVMGGDGTNPLNHIVDRIFYGELEANPEADNLRGKITRCFDTGGVLLTPGYDFKGQPRSITRRLFKKYKEIPNWTDVNLDSDLEAETFTNINETDANGRVTQQTAPDNSIMTPSYNEAGLLKSQKVEHFEPALTSVYIKSIEYNEKRQRSKIIYGNDVTTQFYYDKETFRLNRLESKKQNGDRLQDLYYTYDAVGNITHIEDKNVPVVFFNNQKITGTAEYTYDALYRLAEASGREHSAAISFGSNDNYNDSSYMMPRNAGDPIEMRNYTQQYSYDEAGNLKSMVHLAAGNNWTRLYEYEKNNNRIKTTSVGADDYTYSHHTKHGFITSLPHLQDMGWNFREELIKTSKQKVNPANGTPETTWYQYDGMGQRIRKITENSAQAGVEPTLKDERIYLAGYELYKKHSGPNAGLQRASLSLTDEGRRFAMVETRNDVDDGTEKRLDRYQLPNHIGSTAIELDKNAQIISYEEYHPFGTTAYQATDAGSKAASKRYRYTGMERDEETGLEYHSARYYLPWLGRWLNGDPAGLKDGPNLYSYCKNNPVISWDRSGLSTDSPDEPISQILDLEKAIGIPVGGSGESSNNNFLDDIIQSITWLGKTIGNAIISAGKWIAQAAETAWNWTKEAVTDAWNWIKKAATAAWEWTKKAVTTAWNWTKKAVETAWNWTKKAVSDAWNWIKIAAAATWNWVIAPLIRTGTNALGGFAIGFLSGGLTGGIIGGLTGATTGAIHGWAMASAHSYDWSSGSGWAGFLADNTWGLPNSMIGSLFATANIIGGNPIDYTHSKNSGALMFDNEWFSGYATTLGNVIVGTKNLSNDVVQHELAHVLQARLFGPIFYPSMITHYAINTILPYWLIYHNSRYPNVPIKSFGQYFSRGVYPHTWAEEWGYAVGGSPN